MRHWFEALTNADLSAVRGAVTAALPRVGYRVEWAGDRHGVVFLPALGARTRVVDVVVYSHDEGAVLRLSRRASGFWFAGPWNTLAGEDAFGRLCGAVERTLREAGVLISVQAG